MTRNIHDEHTVEEPVHPANVAGDELTLLVVSGPEAGRWFRVPSSGGVIGRKSNVAMPVADPAISRRHATIEVDDQGYLIRDLGSRNGLYVQGKRVETEYLREGDQIQLSTATVLRVRFRGTEETELIDEMQKAASTDSLTGVANRRYLMGRLGEELSFAWRHRLPVSVLMIDLDLFKDINDAHGHATGDQVLRAVAQALNQAIRVEDVLARYGGDEFVIISRGYGPDKALQFGRRLCRIVRSDPLMAGGQALTVTLSIGVAGCGEEMFDDPRIEPIELLARADTALYQTKRDGRDGVTAWTPPEPTEPTDDDWLRSTHLDLVEVDPE